VTHPALRTVLVGPAPAGEGFLNRRVVLPVISAVFKEVYADLRIMEEDLANSGTDWTVVRPPKLVNKPVSGHYRTAVGANVARGSTISRADVAHAMLAALDDPATIRRPVGVAY
jgi:uncharacterized protein YbjT (DUF2867 family)